MKERITKLQCFQRLLLALVQVLPLPLRFCRVSLVLAHNEYRINAVQNLRWFVRWQFCIEFNPLLAVCVGLVRLPVSFSSFLFFEGRKSLNHFVNNFFHFFVAHTKLYRIFVV